MKTLVNVCKEHYDETKKNCELSKEIEIICNIPITDFKANEYTSSDIKTFTYIYKTPEPLK